MYDSYVLINWIIIKQEIKSIYIKSFLIYLFIYFLKGR